LGRALRTRWQKWSSQWTRADGLIRPSVASQAVIAKHALGMRSYSPTALQNYAACPYRFFLQAIHRLAPRDVPEAIDELDPLQRGSLIHEIQFELFERLRKAHLLPVSRQNLEHAGNLLDEVIEEVASQFYADLAPAIDRVWDDGIDSIRVDLREWLRRASENDSGYVPWRFELSFGLADSQAQRRQADPHSTPKPIDLDSGIQLRGSIDLVERHSNGHIRITDHKTGKADGEDGQIIAGGKSLQPALYALVAEKLFRGELKVEGGRLVLLHFGRRIYGNCRPSRSIHPKFHHSSSGNHRGSTRQAVFTGGACRAAMCVVRLPNGLRSLRGTANASQTEATTRAAAQVAGHAMTVSKVARLADDEARRRILTDLDTTLFVEAAAGTGKTTALVGRIVALICEGISTLDRVVAVTFTEKAAGEMKLRLQAEIERARNAADITPERSARLAKALSQLELARIGTIHAFCGDLLRERPVEAGIDPLFEVAAEDQAGELMDRAFDGWLG
jgi:hypothetical protein